MLEIRDYHYRKDLFDEYKAWAERAVPVLKDKLDVVAFWIDSGADPELHGTEPVESPLGHANVTWVLRWDSMEARTEGLPRALGSAEWQAVWAEHPDQGGYQQMLSRFMESM